MEEVRPAVWANNDKERSRLKTVNEPTTVESVLVPLSVVVHDKYIEETFYVIRENIELDLLGMPWMEKTFCMIIISGD